MRTRIYVDGLNLYYGALKGTRFKWLDPVALARRVLPDGHVIDRLKYFTARVSGISNPDAPARQQVYFDALGTVPEVEVHFGKFLSKTIWRPLINLPVAERRIDTPQPVTLPAGAFGIAGPRAQMLPVGSYSSTTGKRRKKNVKPLPNAVIAEVHAMEEKGSDVNLAVHLLNDAWKDLFDVAAVISNDTDLVTPIRITATERCKVVYICPGRWQVASKLAEVASHVRHIRPSMLRAAQFPDRIPGTTISKPADW